MPIVTSVIRSDTVQADGSRSVHEQHTDHNGRIHDVSYFCPEGLDPVEVMHVRAARIGEEVDRREALELESHNFRMSWTKLQFERRFTDPEWAAVQEFNAAFEAHPALSAEQKLAIRRGLSEYKVALDVNPGDAGTVAMVQLYEALGLIAPGRAAEIIGNG